MGLEDYYNKLRRTNRNIGVRVRRANFIFLTDGSMIYDYSKFNDCDEAIIDAVVNHGEKLDDMLDMVYHTYNQFLKDKMTEEIVKTLKNKNVSVRRYGLKETDSLVKSTIDKYNKAVYDHYVKGFRNVAMYYQSKIEVYQEMLSEMLGISKLEVREKFCKYKDLSVLDDDRKEYFAKCKSGDISDL